MVDPTIVVASGTAGIGLWVLVTGGTLRGLPKWPLEGSTLRVAGAYDLLGSIFAIGLSMAGNRGVAFMTYAVLSLAFAAVLFAAPKLKPGT